MRDYHISLLTSRLAFSTLGHGPLAPVDTRGSLIADVVEGGGGDQ